VVIFKSFMDILRKKFFLKMKEILDKHELWVYSRLLSNDNLAHKVPFVVRGALATKNGQVIFLKKSVDKY
jgi:hypothetical protein